MVICKHMRKARRFASTGGEAGVTGAANAISAMWVART